MALDTPARLLEQPLLPNFERVRDRKLAALFERYLPPSGPRHVLELGCGASRWLPYLAIHKRCDVVGVDAEPSAVELTVANLEGAGADGAILCRDAFDWRANRDLVGRFQLVYSLGLLEHFDDVVERLRSAARYLRKDGVLLTLVPNFRGLNWLLQRYGDLAVLRTHVIYTAARLRRRHEEAGCTPWPRATWASTTASSPIPRRRRRQVVAGAIAASAGRRASRRAHGFEPPERGSRPSCRGSRR